MKVKRFVFITKSWTATTHRKQTVITLSPGGLSNNVAGMTQNDLFSGYEKYWSVPWQVPLKQLTLLLLQINLNEASKVSTTSWNCPPSIYFNYYDTQKSSISRQIIMPGQLFLFFLQTRKIYSSGAVVEKTTKKRKTATTVMGRKKPPFRRLTSELTFGSLMFGHCTAKMHQCLPTKHVTKMWVSSNFAQTIRWMDRWMNG